MKAYTKPVMEVKEFGLSAAIADLNTWLDDNADLGLVIDANAITSYAFVS